MDLKNLLNAFFTGLNAHIDRGFDSVVKAIKKTESSEKDAENNIRAIQGVGFQIEKAIKRLPEPVVDVKVDISPLKKELTTISGYIKKITDKEGVETNSIEALLKMILTTIKENQPEKIGEKIDALDVVFKGLKPKDSVRFDDTQMKGLMAALTNSQNITTTGNIKSATSWTVDRVAITLANTEYSYTFPSNTVSWTFKLRTQGATLYYSSVTGKLPVSGNNTTYMTLLPVGARSQDGMEWGGKTMYFESDTAGQVVEIEIFTM